MNTAWPQIDRIYEHELSVYFKYEHLDASDLVDILSNFNKLYNKILSLSAPVHIHNYHPYRNFAEISRINTGDSIIFKLKEGWRPEFRIERGDVIVYVPKNLGVPILIFYLILKAVQVPLELYKTYQEMGINALEHKIKEIDLYKKLEEERRIKRSCSVTYQVNKTVRFLVENPRVTHVEVDGIKLQKH